MIELVFASGNKGKIAEVNKIMLPEFKVISIYELGEVPDIIEDGTTFEENAFIKAEAIYNIYKKPTIADDSGLAVDQLDGKPGVFSARYAGENCTYDDNNKKLIEELSNYPEPHTAQFICCAVYFDGRIKKSVTGILKGEIINEFRGQNGFGYDPIFQAANEKRTLAEMRSDEKNKISHRAKAFSKLKKILLTK